MKDPHTTDHMANERTFLSWIRTSVGIMAFGFVVERFALFLEQIKLFIGKSNAPMQHTLSHSSIIGVFLVALGLVMAILAFFKFKKVERQINSDAYHPSTILPILLTLSILIVGIYLILYLNSDILKNVF